MILNNAENIMIGDTDADAVYLGDEEIWSRSNAIELDVTRFDPANPKLYDKKGTELATLSMLTGTIADNVYTSDGGLRLTSAASAEIPVEFDNESQWTLTYKFKALNTNTSVNPPSTLLSSNGSNLMLSCYYSWNGYGIGAYIKGMSGVALSDFTNGAYIHNAATSGVEDMLTPYNDLPYYEQEVRWVNDGEYYKLYINGLYKVKTESYRIPDITKLYLSATSSFYNNTTNFICTGLKIEDKANITPSYNVYRLAITKIRDYVHGQVNAYSLSRLCLYDANGNRLDTDPRTIAGACINYYGYYYKIFDSGTGSTLMFVSNNSGTFFKDFSYEEEYLYLYIHVPANLPAAAKYSIITGEASEYGTRHDPVSWTLAKSDDMGVTWTELDTKTDYDTPTARSTETAKFTV